MNLVGFHRLLIGAAILFFAGYAAWEAVAFARGRGTVHLFLGAAAIAGAVLLALYLRRLQRFLGLPDPPGDRPL